MALRFGLELEMHGIYFTFKREDSFVFWDPTPSAALRERHIEDTMIAQESILVPLNPPLAPNPPFLNAATQKVNWENEWGFRVVGDSHATATIKPVGGVPSTAGSCILELATAAAPVNSYNYWADSRRSAKAFTKVIDDYVAKNPANPKCFSDENLKANDNQPMRWNTLESFIDSYNPLVPDRFKVTKSTAILAFEAGTHAKANGHHWEAYVVCPPSAARFCDVQVTYQLPLRSLYTDTDVWISTWNSIWATKYSAAALALDPAVGDNGNTPFQEPYRVQTYAAMWRQARSLVNTYYPATIAAPNDTLVKALLMYVLVAVSVTNLSSTSASLKNAYPQLPKTSPASIARQIVAILPAANAFFVSLCDDTHQDTARVISGRLRNKAELTTLPTTPLMPDQPRFSDEDGGTLAPFPAPAPDVRETWRGSFTLDAAHNLVAGDLDDVLPGNSMGFTPLDPFHVRWAADVNSSLAATRYARVVDGPLDEIKMLFESRYGRCVLNLGFNPYIQDFLFNRSYRRMLRLLAGPPAPEGAPAGPAGWRLSEVAAIVDGAFPDNGKVKQNFKYGVH